MKLTKPKFHLENCHSCLCRTLTWFVSIVVHSGKKKISQTKYGVPEIGPPSAELFHLTTLGFFRALSPTNFSALFLTFLPITLLFPNKMALTHVSGRKRDAQVLMAGPLF